MGQAKIAYNQNITSPWRISWMAAAALTLLLIGLWNLSGPGVWWHEG